MSEGKTPPPEEEPRRRPTPVDHGRVTLVGITGRLHSQSTQAVLRRRLRGVVLLLLFAAFLWLARSLFITPPRYLPGQAAAIAVLVALAGLLWSPARLSGVHLRVIEATIFGVAVARLLWFGYNVLRDLAAAGNHMLALAEMYNLVLAVFALIVIYGTLIPNTWQRALVMITPMALVPPLELLLLRWRRPEAFRTIVEVSSIETLSSMYLMLLLGALVAVSGSHLIYRYRRQALEARELGHYRLEKRIATGGMGEIWQAHHRFLARPAAVKVIHPEKIDPGNPDGAEMILHRFEQEAQATAELESLHTVRVYDFGMTDAGDFYYAMELLQGLDLETLVRRFGPVQAERTVHFLLQACDSLAEAHDRGHIHRDIKPSNLFVCKVGRTFDVIKVLDFGLVTRAGSEAERDTRLNAEGEMTGTPAYMAPEQVLAKTVIDHRADIYALGCVAYWLLTGHLVFDIDRPIAMAVAHVKAKPMPPSHRTELPVPSDLEEIILRCLNKNPEDRPPTIDELGELLESTGLAQGWSKESARDWWLRHRPLEVTEQTASERPPPVSERASA